MPLTKENKKKTQTAAANGTNISAQTEPFPARMAELFSILRKEKPREIWPNWVWICFQSLWKTTFPKHYPRLSDESGSSFLAGFIVGCSPKLKEIFSQSNSGNTELGFRTAFAVTPEEHQKEALRFFQSKDIEKKIAELISWEEMAANFPSWPKTNRAAFARGLLAGTLIEEELVPFIAYASGTALNLNGALWLSWPEIANCSDVSDAFRHIEAAYTDAGFSPPTPEAFKQRAHRIGLSRFLKQQKQGRSK